MVHVKKGELTQEEQELLEVIGKGVGAGLRPRRCRSGQGAWRSPGGARGPADPGLRFCEVGSAGPGNTVSPFWFGTGCGGGEVGREKHCWEESGRCQTRPLNRLLERCTFLGPISDYNGRPRGVGRRMCVQHSSGDFAHGPSWRQWPGSFSLLDGCLKGPFDFRRPKDLDSLAVSAPAWGVEEATKGSILY